MYQFLTGSASWYAMTLLTEAFGVRGEGGDLVLSPKLLPSQFDSAGVARVSTRFAGAAVQVTYRNPDRRPIAVQRIAGVSADGREMPVTQLSERAVLIQREVIAQRPAWDIEVTIQ